MNEPLTVSALARSVWHDWRRAWGTLVVFAALFKSLEAWLFVPATALVLSAVLARAGHIAVSNQDILDFMLTPIGLLYAALMGTVAVALLLLEQAGVMVLVGLPGSAERRPAKDTLRAAFLQTWRVAQLGAVLAALLAQTNATLLDAGWCAFLRRPDVHLGVSVDGPDFLHDRHRRTRQGRGTLDRVLRGIQLLQEHEIPFQVLTVLTADSLDYPDELFDFYQANRIDTVGFNVEEIEGPHTASSLQRAGTPERFRRFLARFLTLASSADPPLVVRELETSATALLSVRRSGPGARTQENKPWAIVNVDCAGNFSTYSPELLGLSSATHGSFTLGNVATDPLEAVLASARLQRLEDEISHGIDLCRESCAYFPFCGGGSPGNKYFENGTFASTETLFCRLHKKVCLDVTVALLEQDAASAGAAPPTEPVAPPERAPA